MADQKKTKIIIDSGDHGGGKPIVVNGQFRFRIPYNQEFEVDDSELEVLRNSNTNFRIVGDPASSAPAGAEGALAPAGDPQARASRQAFGGTTDSVTDRQPVRELAHDERAGTEAALKLQMEERGRKTAEAERIEAESRESGSEAEQADTDAAPAGDGSGDNPDAGEGVDADMEQGNEGPAPGADDGGNDESDQSGDDSSTQGGNEGPDAATAGSGGDTSGGVDSAEAERQRQASLNQKADSGDDEGQLNGGRFSAKAVLDQPIDKIREDLDELNPRQLRSLLDHENKADKPRVGLIRALEKKLAPAAE